MLNGYLVFRPYAYDGWVGRERAEDVVDGCRQDQLFLAFLGLWTLDRQSKPRFIVVLALVVDEQTRSS